MSKAKKRREARRRARQRHEEERPQEAPDDQAVDAERGESAEAGAVRHPAGAQPVHSRAARKRTKRRGGVWARVSRVRVSPWLIATPVVVGVVAVVAVLVLTSGSSGTTVDGGSGAEDTVDPRVAGLPVDVSFDIAAGDGGPGNPAATSFFQPDTFTANAGDVIELVVTNTGSVTHNIWVAGDDDEYDTEDDFGPIDLITPGEAGRLVVKIDQPGTYKFRCQIHPAVQTGTLVLQ